MSLSTKTLLFVDKDIKNDGLSTETPVFVDRLSFYGVHMVGQPCRQAVPEGP